MIDFSQASTIVTGRVVVAEAGRVPCMYMTSPSVQTRALSHSFTRGRARPCAHFTVTASRSSSAPTSQPPQPAVEPDYSSLPYSKIQAWSVETAGRFDRDCELEMSVQRTREGQARVRWFGGYQGPWTDHR